MLLTSKVKVLAVSEPYGAQGFRFYRFLDQETGSQFSVSVRGELKDGVTKVVPGDAFDLTVEVEMRVGKSGRPYMSALI